MDVCGLEEVVSQLLYYWRHPGWVATDKE